MKLYQIVDKEGKPTIDPHGDAYIFKEKSEAELYIKMGTCAGNGCRDIKGRKMRPHKHGEPVEFVKEVEA